MRHILPFVLATAAASAVATPVMAVPTIRVAHLLHHYAGGGACMDRFLIERAASDSAVELTDIHIELQYEQLHADPIAVIVDVPRLGANASDSWDDVTAETISCPGTQARLTVRKATASFNGASVDLLAARAVQTMGAPTTKVNLPHRAR